MTENIAPWSVRSSAPSTPTKPKAPSSAATSPLQNLANFDRRMVRSEQVKPFVIKRGVTGARASTWITFCWTFAAIKQMQTKFIHEKKQLLEQWTAYKQEIDSQREADESKITALRSERQLLKLQLAKSEETRRKLEASSIGQQAALRAELQEAAGRLEQLQREQSTLSAQLRESEASEHQERSMRLEMIRHHQTEIILVSRTQEKAIEDLRQQLQEMRNLLQEREALAATLKTQLAAVSVESLREERMRSLGSMAVMSWSLGDHQILPLMEQLRTEYMLESMGLRVRGEEDEEDGEDGVATNEPTEEGAEPVIVERSGFFSWLAGLFGRRAAASP